MTIEIRSAQKSDIPFILTSIFEVNNKSGMTDPAYLTETILEQDVFSENPAASIIIASKDNQSVGFAMYTPMYFTTLGRTLWVTQIFTHSDYRKQGIATQMLDYLKEQNPEYKALLWAAAKDNNAAKDAFDKITPMKVDGISFYISKQAA